MPDPEWMNKIEIYLSIVLSPLFENWARLGRIDKYSQVKKVGGTRGERERLFGSREREGKLKITFPFYGKGTGIRKCYGKEREWEI